MPPSAEPTVIAGGTVVGSGGSTRADVLIANGSIREVGEVSATGRA